MSACPESGTARPLPAVPYLATAQWYFRWFEALMAGNDDSEARLKANAPSGTVPRGCRQWNRACLGGAEGLLLSVPIAGGTSAAKRLSPEETVVSGHGDWPRQHIGALETLLGRTPYHPLLSPDLERVIRQAPGRTLAELGEEIHELILRCIGFREAFATLRELPAARRDPVREAGRELRRHIDPEAPFWELVARKGPAAFLALVP